MYLFTVKVGCTDVAVKKARTAALFAVESGMLGKMSQPGLAWCSCIYMIARVMVAMTLSSFLCLTNWFLLDKTNVIHNWCHGDESKTILRLRLIRKPTLWGGAEQRGADHFPWRFPNQGLIRQLEVRGAHTTHPYSVPYSFSHILYIKVSINCFIKICGARLSFVFG